MRSKTFRLALCIFGVVSIALAGCPNPTTIKDLEPALDRVTFVAARLDSLDSFN